MSMAGKLKIRDQRLVGEGFALMYGEGSVRATRLAGKEFLLVQGEDWDRDTIENCEKGARSFANTSGWAVYYSESPHLTIPIPSLHQ
jgi:hypothetical protein